MRLSVLSKQNVDTAKAILGNLARGIDPITGETLPDCSPYSNPAVIRAIFTAIQALSGDPIEDVNQTISVIARGINSGSGGPISPFPPKNASKSLEERRQDNLRLGKPINAGTPWGPNERLLLATKFKNGQTNIQSLAMEFGRTPGAISSELAHQGLIEVKTPLNNETSQAVDISLESDQKFPF